MKKRRIPSRAAALAVAFILAFTPLAACAGDGEPGQEPAPQVGEGETETPGNGGEYGEPPGGNMPLGSPIAPASHINTITNIGELEDEINEIIGDAEKKGTISLDVGTAETLFSTVAPNQITVDTEIWLTSRKPLTLTVTGSSRHFGFDIDDGATLTLYLDNITLEGGSFKGGIQTTGRGALSLQGGTVTGCDYSTINGSGGGGVYAANGNVEIGGNAVIADNTATSGGGVYAGSGVKISGNAVIADNTAASGGGIYAANGNVEIGGNAVIADNKAFNSGGGGVYASDDVIISGGEISGNEARNGGGVYAAGDVEINGRAEISNNEADNGGGVYTELGDVIISGNAVIADNVADNGGGGGGGGGVFASGDVEIKDNAIITGNEVRNGAGGGIYARNNVKITGNAFINRNTTGYESRGGGVYAEGDVEINGRAEISNNEAGNGGGVYAEGKAEISGSAKITGNTAYYGGGIYTFNGYVEIRESAEIFGNKATDDGGGVWANNANNITVTGGSFKGNLAGNGGYWITGADKSSAPYKDWGGYPASAPFTHIANNFDIVYSTGLPPVHVAAFSMNDSAGTEFFRTVITAPGPLPDFPDDPSRDGFAFTGWNEEADGSGGRVTKNSIFNTTQRVYAQWEILPPKPPSSSSDDDSVAYVTVTFDTRGGSAVNRISVAVKGILKLPAAPVREGYRFTGWYTDAALAKPFSPDTLITHSMTLYAGWELLEDIEPEPAVEEEPLQEAAWQNPFADVHERDWFYGDVAYVYEHGLMTGVSQEQFSPAAPVTRGMAAAVLWRFGNCPTPAEPPAFADLSRHWYRDAVAWANESGIAAGYSPGIFGPEDDITREQLAVMLYNYARYAGVDANGQEDLSGYADHGEISGYALEAMAWASSKGYISGRSQRELAPKGTATRAEMAAILHRFKEDITKE